MAPRTDLARMLVPLATCIAAATISGSATGQPLSARDEKPSFAEDFETIETGLTMNHVHGALSSDVWAMDPPGSAPTISWFAPPVTPEKRAIQLQVPGDWTNASLLSLQPGTYATHTEFGTTLGLRIDRVGSIRARLPELPPPPPPKPASPDSSPARASKTRNIWTQFRILIANSNGPTTIDVEALDETLQHAIRLDRIVYEPTQSTEYRAVSRFLETPLPVNECSSDERCSARYIRWTVRTSGAGFVALDDVVVSTQRPNAVVVTSVVGDATPSSYLRTALEAALTMTGAYIVVPCDSDIAEQQAARKQFQDQHLVALEQAQDKGRLLEALASAGCRMPPVSTLYGARLAIHEDHRTGRRELILTLRNLDNSEEQTKTGWVSEPDAAKPLSWSELVRLGVLQLDEDWRVPNFELKASGPNDGNDISITTYAKQMSNLMMRPTTIGWRVFYCPWAQFCEKNEAEISKEWAACVRDFSQLGTPGRIFYCHGSAEHAMDALVDTGVEDGAGVWSSLVMRDDVQRHSWLGTIATRSAGDGFKPMVPGEYYVLAVSDRDNERAARAVRVPVPDRSYWGAEVAPIVGGSQGAVAWGVQAGVDSPLRILVYSLGLGATVLRTDVNWTYLLVGLRIGGPITSPVASVGAEAYGDVGARYRIDDHWGFGIQESIYITYRLGDVGPLEPAWKLGAGGGVAFGQTGFDAGFGGLIVRRRF